jgi:apoptosis-inducing factor 2
MIPGGPRTNKIYKKIQSDMQIVPVGSSGGIGIAFGYKLPSFMVKMVKAKDFMIGNAVKTVEGTA